jgi:S1-C subfamily serine protease
MDTEVAQNLGIDYVQGVAVVGLDPTGSATQSGIKANDVIVKINGKSVTSDPELREYIGRSKAGETLSVTVVRSKKEIEIPVRLKTRNDN